MPMDAVFLRALTEEIRPRLTGMKIDKIFQPTRDQIIFHFRGNLKLLLCAGANAPRAHFTRLVKENPATPPMFCMLLRKYLLGARIIEVSQPPVERLIRMELDCTDELGRSSRRSLILEAMGRRSNLILLDESGRIIDCLRRVDSEMSANRQILPGLFYYYPDAGDRLPFIQESEAHFRDKLNENIKNYPEKNPEKFLLENYFGFSPLMAREIIFRTRGETEGRICDFTQSEQERFCQEFFKFQDDVIKNKFTPYCLKRDGVPAEFSCLPVSQYGETWERYPDFSELMDAFYDARDRQERVKIRGAELLRAAKTALERTRRKLILQEKDYQISQNREEYRVKGDLITANLYQIRRGENILICENFYSENNNQIKIALDPALSPQKNAAAYYKRYAKLRNAEKYLDEQIQKARQDIFYLESVLEELERAESEQDFLDIRRELIENGFLRVGDKNNKNNKNNIKRGGKNNFKNNFKTAGKPREFDIPSGYRVLVGRNNQQNDFITKNADRRDIWLHTQKIHGSHVILCTDGREPDENSILTAASIAAYYSQARENARTPVDYTPVRYVKKPAGARPGMVIYTKYQTVFVEPKTPENIK